MNGNRRHGATIMRGFLVAFVATAGITYSGSGESAPITALTFPAQPGTTLPYVNGTDGWQFTPSADIRVTSLGYYDDGANGLLTPHTVGIFNTATQALVTPTVTVNSSTALDGLFRFAPSAPVVLNAGQSYTVAGNSVAPFDALVNNPSGQVFAPEVQFGQYRVQLFSGFQFPSQLQPGNFFPAANFQFESVVTPPPLPPGAPVAAQVVVASSLPVAQAPAAPFVANWKSNLDDAIRGEFLVYKEGGAATTLTNPRLQIVPSAKTYVLVHGWSGPVTSPLDGTALAPQEWVQDMAAAIKKQTPDANVLLYDWSKFASSVPVDQQGVANGDFWVPNNRVPLEAASLASQLNVVAKTLQANGSSLGEVQILGHSLGAGVAARATEALQGSVVNVERLTLFDPPENADAAASSGRVNLAPVISNILARTNAPIIENYIAGAEGLGYGLPYRLIANTELNHTTHGGIFGTQSPMSWYQETVNPTPSLIDLVLNPDSGIRGINESGATLNTRADQLWQNADTAPLAGNFTLSKLEDLSTAASLVKSFFVAKVVDLTSLVAEKVTLPVYSQIVKEYQNKGIISDITIATKEVGLAIGSKASEVVQKTIQVVASAGNAIAGTVVDGSRKVWDSIADARDSAIANLSSIAVGPGWLSFGSANFEQGRGLVNTSHSPSYAFTEIHIPNYIDTVYFDFHPEIWGPGDYYVIGVNGDLIYYLPSDLFTDSIMNTGFLDIARWSGQDITLTIGLISDEDGHSVATRDYMFLSSSGAPNANVPEPSSLVLMALALGILVWGMRYRMKSADGVICQKLSQKHGKH